MRNLNSFPSSSSHFHEIVPIFIPVVLEPPKPFMARWDSTNGPSKSSIRLEIQPVHRLSTPIGTASVSNNTMVSAWLEDPLACIARADIHNTDVQCFPRRCGLWICLAMFVFLASRLLFLALVCHSPIARDMGCTIAPIRLQIGRHIFESLLRCDFGT
jgi:hypothetical protein